jgi:hypothetical protein
MSAYLVIGLATRIMAQKRFFRSRFDNKSELKDEMERLFNATDIYSIYEDEDVIVFNLKPDVAKKEMKPFLKAFYDLYLGNNEDDTADTLKEVSKYNSLKRWMEIANGCKYRHFKHSKLYFSLGSKNQWQCSFVTIDGIMFDFSYPMIVEDDNGLFAFFTRLLRERLAGFRLAQGLFVDITT